MITIYRDTVASPLPAWKRTLDIVLSALALPALGVLMLVQFVSTLAVPGPVFFRQVRVGYRGRRFCL